MNEITLSDVEDVSFSNSDLVAVAREGSDWRLTSLAPFLTEETLFLALINGQNVEIKVTDEPELLKKEIYSVDGNKVTYKVTINSNALGLNGGEPLTLTDTLYDSKNYPGYTDQSINYHSVQFSPEDPRVSFDYSGSTGTYIIPDKQAMTITYTTRVLGEAGATCTFGNKAILSGSNGQMATDETISTQPVYPTASDVDSSAGYMLKLLVYGGSNIQNRLSGAKYTLLDANQRPVLKSNGDPATFETDGNGEADIWLDAQADGVTIEKNTVYYLDMVQTPAGYRKDNTLYSFMITDDAGYDSGGVYTYFNGDTMKIRLQPEESSLNVAVRFAGNYELTQDQKNRIKVVLEKKNGDDWQEVESYTYARFDRGALTFNTGKEEAPFEFGATYRVREDVSDLWDIDETISKNISYSLVIGTADAIEGEEAPEFTVTEDNVSSSFNLVIKNEYVEHKLTIIKMDKETGEKLSQADFEVRNAANDTVVKRYITDENGELVITGGGGLESEVLYYVVETYQPDGYLLPLEPEKNYFFFCNDETLIPEILEGLPEGKTAVNLTDSYDSLTLDNKKEKITVPVMATWQGNDWPATVKSVKVQLLQSVDGAEPTPVENVEDVELTENEPYNKTHFVNLPTRSGSSEITYSIQEIAITGRSDENLLDSYVKEYPISDSGIYIAHNKEATSLTVNNVWVDSDGNVVTDPDVLGQQAEVTFDVYRSAVSIETAPVNSDDMAAFVAGLEKVREDQSFEAGSDTAQIEGLDKYYFANSEFKPYYYYVLETVPSFGDEVYQPDEENRAVTIRNRIAPETVLLTVKKAELVDDPRPESAETDCHFTLTLTKGSRVIRSYTVYNDSSTTLTTDKDGVVSFDLKPEADIELTMPVDVTATITEAENREYTTSAYIDPEDPVEGRVFSHDVTQNSNGETVTFVNTLHVVCKVVDVDGEEHAFESFKSALTFIRDSANNAYIEGLATIQMIDDYTMPATDLFDVRPGENIALTTAATASEDPTDPTAQFPFMSSREGADTAIVTRGGEDGGSMITNEGTLTLSKIVLDGAKDSFIPDVNGGLIHNTGELTLGEDTTLRNSAVTGKGGAVYCLKRLCYLCRERCAEHDRRRH